MFTSLLLACVITPSFLPDVLALTPSSPERQKAPGRARPPFHICVDNSANNHTVQMWRTGQSLLWPSLPCSFLFPQIWIWPVKIWFTSSSLKFVFASLSVSIIRPQRSVQSVVMLQNKLNHTWFKTLGLETLSLVAWLNSKMKSMFMPAFLLHLHSLFDNNTCSDILKVVPLIPLDRILIPGGKRALTGQQ